LGADSVHLAGAGPIPHPPPRASSLSLAIT
jgi:hypothetical protein